MAIYGWNKNTNTKKIKGENDDSKKRIYPPYKEEIEMIKNKKFNSNMISEIRSKN